MVRVASLEIRDGDMGMEVHLPDAEIRRVLEAPTRGLTHRQLLPLYPRTRNPGARYFESTIHFDMPRTQRSEVDIRIPPIRSKSCSPLFPNRSCSPMLSGITNHLNTRVKRVTDQANAIHGKAQQAGGKKPVWDPSMISPMDMGVKQELLKVMEKVKSASVFFADSQPGVVVHQKEESAKNVPSRTKYKSPGQNGGERMTRNQTDEALQRRLQDYRQNPEEFRSFKQEVRDMLGISMKGVSNKIERNIALVPNLSPDGRARNAHDKRVKGVAKKEALSTFKAGLKSDYDLKCQLIEAKHEANRVRADKAIEDRFKQATMAKRQQFEQAWTKNCAGGSRMAILVHTLLDGRPLRQKLKVDSAACRKIQVWYRRFYWRRKSAKIQRGFKKLKILIRSYHKVWKVKRLYKAAFVILTALNEMQSQNQSATAVKTYCRKVRRAQRSWRKYVAWRDFVLDTRKAHFNKFEARVGPDWEKKKVQIEQALAKATSNDDPDEIMGGFDLCAPPPKVTEEIIDQVIRTTFRNDQLRMQSEMVEYANLMKGYRIKMGTWQALQQAKDFMKSGAQKKKKKDDGTGEPPPPRPERPVILPKLTDEQTWALIKEGQRLTKAAK